ASLAFRFTRHHEDSLDVMQETFTYFLRKFPGFVLTSTLMTFFYPAVKNLSIAARRKRHRALGTVVEDTLNDLLAPPESTAPSELSQALARLSDSHREVVLMRYIDDLTIEEIAAALGIPPGTVKSRLHNALRQLRADPMARTYFL